MEIRRLKYRKKYFNVTDTVHKGYESSLRKFIRNNNKSYENTVPVENVNAVRANLVPDVADEVINKVMIEEMLSNISLLEKNEQIVIYEHYFNELSFRKIAILLKISRTSIDRLHKKALAKLETMLKK